MHKNVQAYQDIQLMLAYFEEYSSLNLIYPYILAESPQCGVITLFPYISGPKTLILHLQVIHTTVAANAAYSRC